MLAKALVVVAIALTAVNALSAGAARRHRIAAAVASGADEEVDVPDSMPVDVFATLEKRGAWTITGLVIQRTPIQSFIPKVLNFLSGGKWREALDSAGGYDKMFHLAVIATIQSPDGKTVEHWKVEKSPNVEMTKVDAKALDATSPEAVKAKLEAHPFVVPPNTKLQDLFKEAKATPGFWLYDAFNRPPYAEHGGNCQDFVRRILTTISGGHLPQATTEWVFQDGVTIGEHLGWFSRAVAKGLTNTGAMVDIVKDIIAHPMVKARQLSSGSFVESEADAQAQDEDEVDAEDEEEVEDEAEAEDEAEDEAEEEAEEEDADEFDAEETEF